MPYVIDTVSIMSCGEVSSFELAEAEFPAAGDRRQDANPSACRRQCRAALRSLREPIVGGRCHRQTDDPGQVDSPMARATGPT